MNSSRPISLTYWQRPISLLLGKVTPKGQWPPHKLDTLVAPHKLTTTLVNHDIQLLFAMPAAPHKLTAEALQCRPISLTLRLQAAPFTRW